MLQLSALTFVRVQRIGQYCCGATLILGSTVLILTCSMHRCVHGVCKALVVTDWEVENQRKDSTAAIIY